MSQIVVHSPIREAELFLGEEAQHLQSNDRLYQAYTQSHESHLSLYIGQDVATLLANPTVQGQIASKLHSTPSLVQIKVTPQRELFIAKTGTTDFQHISFEENYTPPEVIAIAEKSQQLYLAMQSNPTLLRPEDTHPRPSEWSHGFPTPISSPETAQLHERIHSLESQLANERLRGDMRKISEDIRENHGLLLELLRSRDALSPDTEREIETLRKQLERTTGKVDRLIDQARDRGLAHSAEMHDLLRENNHLRRVYGEAHHELETLHEALASGTTWGNLKRLEETVNTLKERERTLLEALKADFPEDMLDKALEIKGANVELRRQLHNTQGALEEYRKRDHQAADETRRLKHQVSKLNHQYRTDHETIQRLLTKVCELREHDAGNLHLALKAEKISATSLEEALEHAALNTKLLEERLSAVSERAEGFERENVTLLDQQNGEQESALSSQRETIENLLDQLACVKREFEEQNALYGKKVAELQEKHTLLEKLSDQIIHPDSLARQLDQVELSMLPSALEGRLQEISQLCEKHEETLAEARRKDEEFFSLKQALGEARGSLSEFTETKEVLQKKELELEQLIRSAEKMEQFYKEQVGSLKREVGTLKASVEERQGVVNEFYDKMVSAEEQRDAAIKQRDTPRLAFSKKEATIEELSNRIGELEEESTILRMNVEQRGKAIQRQVEELHEQQERFEEQNIVLEDNYLTTTKLKHVNKAQRARLEENEKELEELRYEVRALRAENDRLKLALERIAAVLNIHFKIEDPEELTASLVGRVKEIQASRNQLQEAFDTHTQYLAVAQTAIEKSNEQIEDLTQTTLAQRENFESQVQTLEQEIRSLKTHLKEACEQAAHVDEELRSEHSLNEKIGESAASEQNQFVAQTRELERTFQDREIKYEELKITYYAAREDVARLHEGIELTQIQRDIQQAVNAGKVMKVLGAALGGDAFSLQLGPRDSGLQEVTKNHQDYLTISSNLKAMRALAKQLAKEKGIMLPAAYDLIRDKYYGRHTQTVTSLIAKINSSPGALNKLDLFVDFFKVTGGVSGIMRTKEFARLTAVKRVLARLSPGKDSEGIIALHAQISDLTRILLKNLMGSIYEATKGGSGLTRYSNFGLHLIMWGDILNNLDESLYIVENKARSLKAKDAESLRQTVKQLNVQFHRLMASTHHQTSPGVWVPNA